MSANRTRKVDFQEPALTAAGALGKTGIEFLRDILEGRVPAPPLHATIGFELAEVSDGVARYRLIPGEHLYGMANAVQSGLSATLLEAAMSAAVMTVLDAVTSHSTASLSMQATRAITGRTGKVIAEGWVVHRGSRLVTAEGRLLDDQGRLFAHGSGSYLLVERPTP